MKIKLSPIMTIMALLGMPSFKVGQRPPETNTLSLVRIADAKTDDGYEYIYTINNIHGYKTIEGLNKYIADLPSGSTILWNPGCCRFGDEPLLTSKEEMDKFKLHCESNSVTLILVPSG